MTDNNVYREYTCNFQLYAARFEELRISDVLYTTEKHSLASNATTSHQLTGNQSYRMNITWYNDTGYGYISMIALYRAGSITWIEVSNNSSHNLFTFSSIVYPTIDVRPVITVNNILTQSISYTIESTTGL